jgi:hypothetical protein
MTVRKVSTGLHITRIVHPNTADMRALRGKDVRISHDFGIVEGKLRGWQRKKNIYEVRIATEDAHIGYVIFNLTDVWYISTTVGDHPYSTIRISTSVPK